MTVDRERVLSVLREKQADIEERYGLRMLGIIGSVARGEATADSDVDVMVDVVPARAPSLFKLFDAEAELKEAIGVGLPVEFVFREALRPTMRSRMERELVSI
jgi:predicted nucleotidyltransferase